MVGLTCVVTAWFPGCRNDSVVFVEALAALDEDPSSLLLLPTGAQAHSLESAHVRFQVAVRAVAVHLFGHAAAALARCMRTADAYLQAQWLQLQVKSSDAICVGADMELMRDDLKQVGSALCVHGCIHAPYEIELS